MELIGEIFGLKIKIFNNIYLEQFNIIIENIDNKNVIGYIVIFYSTKLQVEYVLGRVLDNNIVIEL